VTDWAVSGGITGIVLLEGGHADVVVSVTGGSVLVRGHAVLVLLASISIQSFSVSWGVVWPQWGWDSGSASSFSGFTWASPRDGLAECIFAVLNSEVLSFVLSDGLGTDGWAFSTLLDVSAGEDSAFVFSRSESQEASAKDRNGKSIHIYY
jgi:hypothetical protein